MALLYDSRLVARDAAGDAYSGALLYVYVAGGLTPANVYASAALGGGSSLTNPVEADSNGRFPQIFVAQTLFDLVLKTAGGVTIASYEDVSGLGESDGVFERDFTNSRARISGTAGVVSFEAGPATGDDIGGAGRIGGWEGTPADTWEIDALATSVTGDMSIAEDFDVTTPKKLTEGGKRLSEVLYTDATTFTGQSTITIALPNTPSGTRRYKVRLWDLVMSNTAAWLSLRLAYDGVPTFKTGAGDYAYTYNYPSDSNFTGAVQRASSTGATAIRLNESAVSSSATNLMAIDLEIMTVDSGNGVTHVFGRILGHWGTAVAVLTNNSFEAVGLLSYGRATHLQVLATGAGAYTMSGKYQLVTERGYGE